MIDSGFPDFDVEMGDFEVRKSGSMINRLYSVTFGGSVHSLTAVKDGTVYFGCCDHYVYAVDARSGELVWKTKTNGMMPGNSPEIGGDVLYIGTYSPGKTLYALDIGSGRPVWTFDAGKGITTKPLCHEGRVYFGSLDGYFYCLDLGGKEVWRFRTGEEIFYAPSAYNGKIYFGCKDGNFYCLSPEGKEIWRFRTGDEIYCEAPCNFHEGRVYFGSVDNYLYAVEAETGKLAWKVRTGKYGNCFSPVIHKNVIYHGSRDGVLYALDLDGKEIWRFRAGGNIAVGVRISGDRIYLGCEDSNLYCLSLGGKELWRFTTSGQTWCPPSIYRGRAYFGSMDCHLYCIDAESGKKVWSFPTSTRVMSRLDPPYKSWEVEIRTSGREETGGGEGTVNIGDTDKGDYSTESEYSVKSEYVFESEYG